MRYSKKLVAIALSTVLSAVSGVAAAHNVHKEVGFSPAANARVIIDQNTMLSHAPAVNWLKRITLSGMLNIDAAYFSRGWEGKAADGPSGVVGYVPNFNSEIQHSTDIAVNNASLMFDTRIATYLDAHVGLVYRNRVGPTVGPLGSAFTYVRDTDSGTNRIDAYSSHVFVDEAYATLSDFKRYPFYARFGREFTPFGTYATPYPLDYSLTQLLSQTLATVAQIGYVQPSNAGWNGALYVFAGPSSAPKVGQTSNMLSSTRVSNFGIKVGYREPSFGIDLSYIRDIRDVSWINAVRIDNYDRRSSGISLHTDYRSGPWDFRGDYVSASRSLLDKDSRIWAYSVHGGYKFLSFNKRASRVDIGYERASNLDILSVRKETTDSNGQTTITYESTDAAVMPRYRIAASYEVKLNPYAGFTVQYSYNQDDKSQGSATGNSANVFSARFGLHF